MAVLNCNIYHKFPRTLVYKEGHDAKLDQRLLKCQKKHLLLQVYDCRQMICKFRVLLREADAHMNHWAGSLIDCSLRVYYPVNI